MQLARYLRLGARWWWLLAFGLAIGGGSAYGMSRMMTPVYRADATLLVNQTQTPGTIAYNDILTSERLTKTYRELIVRQPVMSDVIGRLDLDVTSEELASMTGVSVISDTQLLRLSVEHADPAQASLLANAIADTFIESNDAAGLTRPGTVSIVEEAGTPSTPVRPRTLLNTIIGALAGLFLASVIAVLYEYLDETVKTSEDVEEAVGIATLGAVSRFPRSAQSSLVVGSPKRLAAAEAYRMLRTNLRFATLDEPARALVVTSASPGEGKTTTVANLAVALAQTGQRVIAVDADLRRPSLHKIFGLTNGAGLTSALISKQPQIESLLQSTEFDNLSVLTCGPIPPNPSELLTSRRMDGIIEALRGRADLVLFDTPPALAVADASIVTGKVDGAVLVVDAGRARAGALRRAAEALGRSKTQVLGVVLNKLSGGRHGYYYGYYQYAPASAPSNGQKPAKARETTPASAA